APGATHWAGLAGPLRVDFDDRHAREGGLVLDLTVDLGTGQRGEASVHPPRTAAGATEGEVLEDNRRPLAVPYRDEGLAHPVEPLQHAVLLPPPFPGEQTSQHPAITGLLLSQELPSTEVSCLHLANAAEGHAQETTRFAVRFYAVQRILVRVEGDGRCRFVRLGRTLPNGHD